MELFLGIASLVVSFLLGVVIYIIKKETDNGDIVPSAVVGAFLMLFLILGLNAMVQQRRQGVRSCTKKSTRLSEQERMVGINKEKVVEQWEQ